MVRNRGRGGGGALPAMGGGRGGADLRCEAGRQEWPSGSPSTLRARGVERRVLHRASANA
eukprot:3675900-Prorocentrum_lima.AAC.1